jgi:hypothetical protein
MVEFAGNGFKGTVAMFVRADSLERREELDQLIMSLPLGCALAVTSLRSEGESLHVELVPGLYEPEEEPNRAEMLRQTCDIIKDAWFYVAGGSPEEVFFQMTSKAEMDDELKERLRLPSTKILMSGGLT